MKITVVGGGPVGLTYCALLQNAGFEVRLWSESLPSGTKERFVGTYEGHHRFEPCGTLEDAAQWSDVVLMARCAPGVQCVLDLLAPALSRDCTVIFSAELSFASSYLAQALGTAGRQAQIIAWSTTVATAQRTAAGDIRVGTIRDLVDMATVDAMDADAALSLCQQLFGDRFRMVGQAAKIGFSNLNPPIHLANSIANLTRIERGEDWDNYQCITPVVGRLIETLDQERLALAGSFGFEVRDVFQHYLMTFPGITAGSVSDMAAQVHARAPGTMGPRSLSTRYITEDVPFGLVPLCALGRAYGVPMPLHEAGIVILSAYLGADLHGANAMLPGVMSALKSTLPPHQTA